MIKTIETALDSSFLLQRCSWLWRLPMYITSFATFV